MKRPFVVLALVSVVSTAAPASAEWFADVYAGRTFTADHDLKVEGRKEGVPVNGRLLDAEFQDSWTYGARLGRYFDTLRFIGVAGDVWQFYPDIKSQVIRGTGTLPTLFRAPSEAFAAPTRIRGADISVTAICLELMLRWPLVTSEAVPYGRVQPYIAAGPGLFVTEIQSFNTDVTLGAKVGAGLVVLFTRDIGVFAEYRLTHLRPEVDSHRLRLKTTLDSQHVVAGLSVRF